MVTSLYQSIDWQNFTSEIDETFVSKSHMFQPDSLLTSLDSITTNIELNLNNIERPSTSPYISKLFRIDLNERFDKLICRSADKKVLKIFVRPIVETISFPTLNIERLKTCSGCQIERVRRKLIYTLYDGLCIHPQTQLTKYIWLSKMRVPLWQSIYDNVCIMSTLRLKFIDWFSFGSSLLSRP